MKTVTTETTEVTETTEILNKAKRMDTRMKHVDSVIRDEWRRDQVRYVTAGGITCLFWIVLLFLLIMAADWALNLPAVMRCLLLAGLFVASVYRAMVCGWQQLRGFDAVHAALKVENRHGQLESLLVSAIQLRQSERGSSVMLARTCELADEAAAALKPDPAFSQRLFHDQAMLVLVMIFMTTLGAAINPDVMLAGLSRVFTPWRDVAYPTRTQINMPGEDIIVREGAPLRLEADISGKVPEKAGLLIKTGKGEPRERSLDVVDGKCVYAAESVFRSFEYRLTAGDASTPWRRVTVVSSPRIVAAAMTLTYPEYTKKAALTEDTLTVTVPEGTRVQWRLTLDRPIRSGELKLAEGAALPLEVSSDGRQVSVNRTIGESRAYRFKWMDKDHGFQFESPRHYLQVAPDRAPSVEFLAPAGNLVATLARDLDLVYQSRDDHGIASRTLAYRVNKTAEKKVKIQSASGDEARREASINWRYREVLPGLAIGDTLSLAIEVSDHYPGPDGPQRARSETRRIQFVSKADYLAQIDKRKHRLLLKVRHLYREQRDVHELIRRLNPTDQSYIQTCQLEAVRQDLLRERLARLRDEIAGLLADLSANKIEKGSRQSELEQLSDELAVIGDKHLAHAANALRDLADVQGQGRSNTGVAIYAVNRVARELALLVLRISFKDASEVMARELHATAQTLATLRQRTFALGEQAPQASRDGLAADQIRLADWCERLLEATPLNKEAVSHDALVAFTLTRMVKMLKRNGLYAGMTHAAEWVKTGANEQAVSQQSDLIARLLEAEFRLRVGAEHEALLKARELFDAQVNALDRLKKDVESAADLSENQTAQTSIHRIHRIHRIHGNLQLLLMPAIPAPIPSLFDEQVMAAPPVDELLANASMAMVDASLALKHGQKKAVLLAQMKARQSFERLADIVDQRIKHLTVKNRVSTRAVNAQKMTELLTELEERLLVLLERTEDSADQNISLAGLTRATLVLKSEFEHMLAVKAAKATRALLGQEDPLWHTLSQAVTHLGVASEKLKANQAEDAINQLEMVLDTLDATRVLLEERVAVHAYYLNMLDLTEGALKPGPQLKEIEQEQRDLYTITEDAKPEDYAAIVIPQKNLVHAVNAVLDAMDQLAHRVKSGTSLLFAKEDMDAAAIGLKENDVDEALDAQDFVAEALTELHEKIEVLTPEYRYMHEIIAHMHELMPEYPFVLMEIRELMARQSGDKQALAIRLKGLSGSYQRFTGDTQMSELVARLGKASLADSDVMADVEGDLLDSQADMLLLMKNLVYLLSPPPDLANITPDTAEVKLLRQVLAVAAAQQDLNRSYRGIPKANRATFVTPQRQIHKRFVSLVKASDSNEKLVMADQAMQDAMAAMESGDHSVVADSQNSAADALRHFVLAYALEFVDVPPPAPPQDGAPSDNGEPEDTLTYFPRGAVKGRNVKSGRSEWQVLGQRDRAALNENFARELPLEYRTLLKDYFQKLAE